MQGLMMDYPLTLTRLLERAATYFPRKRILTKTAEGYHAYTYEDFSERVQRLARALKAMGVGPGDRVASFAWNSHRHLELYFAVPCLGAVLHTVNIRLFPEQIAYIVNHANDKVMFIDDSLFEPCQKLAPKFGSVERYVVMGEGTEPPPSELQVPVESYEALLEGQDPEFAWPDLDEKTACVMCYTSGTTGNPKGVLYTHRSLVLHSLALSGTDGLAVSERDTMLTIVPMFHANAWSLPFGATMLGATQVFPGPFMTPHDLASIIEEQKVTFSSGVPTIWIGLLQDQKEHGHDLSSLRMVTSGGSATPVSMIEAFDKLGIPMMQGWGMTETGPVGTLSWVKGDLAGLPEDERARLRAKQGMALPLIELRLKGDNGEVQPWDGKSMGEVQIRGPWVASTYYEDDRAAESWDEGWLKTGDVGVIDHDGYLQLVDRAKDMIKSGGEWISSVDLEGAIMGHPKVLEAAVLGVAHPKWQERPLACVVLEKDEELTKEELLSFLEDKVAKWWFPDDVVFIEEIPKTSVGKFSKKDLRARFGDYKLPTG
ncbi:MAG: long-chain fatty acid--CoA ligase [Actinomycetota bacterium]